MSVWIELLTLFCLTSTALCGPESSTVIWKNPGEDLTIQCRVTKAEYMALCKGLNEEVQIFFKAQNSKKDNIAVEFKHRFQLNGQFPNMDFLIKNLSSADTGVYWCVYTHFESGEQIKKKGNGSVLLVVRDEMVRTESDDAGQGCETRHLNLVLVCVVVSVFVLLCIVVALAWMFFKTKKLCSTVKPSTVSTNDVYEDMRGRLRS